MNVPQKKRLVDDLSMSTPNKDEMDQIIDNLDSNDFTALNDILNTDPSENLSVNAIQYNKDAPITDPHGLAAGLHVVVVVPGYDKRLSVEETARKEVESQVTVAQKADDALVSQIPNLTELLKPGPFDSTPLDKVGEKKKTDIKLMQVSPLVRYGVRIKVARAGGAEGKRQFYTKIQSLSEYNAEISAGTNQPIVHETQDAYIARMVTVLKAENDRLEAAFIAKEYPLKSFLVRFVWALGGKLGKDPNTPVPVEGHPMEINPVAAARRVMSWMGGSTELVGVPVNSMTGAKFSRPEDWEGDQAEFDKSKQLVETAIFPLLTNIYRALYHSHLLGHSPAFISPGKPAGWNSLFIERNPPATTSSEVAAAAVDEEKKEEEKVPEKEKKPQKKEKKTDEEKALEKQAKKEQKKQEKKTKKEQDRLEELLLPPSARQERVNALLLEYIQALATKEKFRLDGKEQDANGGAVEDNEEDQPVVVPASDQSATATTTTTTTTTTETVKSPIVPLKRISKEIARQCWMVMRPLLRRIVETGKDSLTLEEVPQVFEMFCGLFLDEFVDPLVDYLTDAFKHKPEEPAVVVPDDEYHSAADEESTRIWAALHDSNVELYFYDVVIAVLRSAKNLSRYFPGGLQGTMMVNAEQVEIFFSFITEEPDPKSTKSKETRIELLRAFERLQASRDAALSNLNTRFAEVSDVDLGELVGGDEEESETGGGGEDDESLDSSSSSLEKKTKKKKVREGTIELTDEQAKDREFEIRVAQARRVEEARKILATGPSKEQKAAEDKEDTQKSRDAVAKLNPEELKTELARLDKLVNRNAAPGSPGYKESTMFDLEKFWKERFQLEREEKRHEEADDGYTIYERSTAQGLVDLDEENHQKALKNGDIETIKLRDRARLKALEELAEEEQDESSGESPKEHSPKELSPKLPTPPKNKSAPSPKPMVISPPRPKPNPDASPDPVIVHNPPQKKRIVPLFLGTQAPPEPQKKKRIIEDEEEQVESKVARKTKGDSFGEPIMVPPVVLTPNSVAQSPLQSENSNTSTNSNTSANVIYEKQTPLPPDASVTEETPKYEELKDDEINPRPVPTQSSRNDTLQQVTEKGIERVLLNKILSIISLADFLIAWASKDVKKLYVIYEQRDKGAELLLKAARSDDESGLGSKILFNDQAWRFYYAKTFFWSRTDVKWAEHAGVFASRVLFQNTWQQQFMNYYTSLMSHVLFQETKGIQSIQSGVCWPSGVNGTLTIGVAHFWDGSKHNISFMSNITKEHFAKCFGGRAIVEVSVKRGESTVKSMLDYDANSNDYVASYPYLDEDTQDPQRAGLKTGIHIKIVVGSDSDDSKITVHGAGDKDATLPSKMSLGIMLYADSSLLKLKGASPVFDIMQMYHLTTPSNVLKKDNKESPIYYPYSTDHPVRNISTDRYAGVAFKVRVSDAGAIDVAQEITVTLPRDSSTLQNIVVVQNNSQFSKEAKQHPVSEKTLEPTLIVIHLECYDILHKLFWAPEISYHNSKSLSRRPPTPQDLLSFRSLILKDSGSGKTLQELRVVHEQKKLTSIALPLAVTFGHTDDSRNRDMLVSMDLLNGSIQSVTNVALLKESSAVSMIESRMRKIKVTSPVNGATMSVPKRCASCKSQITSFSSAYSIPSDRGEVIHFACGKSCASAIVVQSRSKLNT